jgi:diguanylate cyclase (GGDEF)-like protein/PAS domain S-box-containing protein
MKSLLPSLNIGQKFIAYLMFLSVIPLLLIGFISYRSASTALQDESSRFTLALVATQRDYLDLRLDQIESLIANLSAVEEIITALDDDGAAASTYESLVTQARIGYILNGYSNLSGLVSIDVFTTGGNHYHVGDTLDVGDIRTELVENLFDQAEAAEGQVLWLGIEDNVNVNSTHHKVITAAKMLAKTDRRTLRKRPLALLLVNYSVESLYNYFSRIDLDKNGYLTIVDGRSRIVYHPDKRVLGSRVTWNFMEKIADADETIIIAVDGEPTSVSHAHSDRSDWTLVGLIPLRTLTARTLSIGVITALLMAICFCVVGVAAVLYHRGVVVPLRDITHRFKQVKSGSLDLSTRVEVDRNDEIGKLIRWFNAFVVATLSARQQSERALRESEERYALTAQTANDGLWDWDLTTDEIYFAPRWKEMLGYAEDEIGNDPREWLERIYPDDRSQVDCAIAAHRSGLTANLIIEHRILHKDGGYRWVLVRGLAVCDTDGIAYRMAGSHTEITERKRIDEQLRHDAMHDALTDLPNRACLLDRLQTAIERNKRHEEFLFAVLFLDLDHFKLINDSLGHSTGDQLLIEAANRLRECVRGTDTVARLGGDEFVVLLEDLDGAHSVTHAAQRMLQGLGSPCELNGHEIVISASIGIAISSTGYDYPEALLRDADIAMYRAKALGKSRYEIFDTAMGDEIVKRLALEMDLRRAIERRELELHYQPIVSLGEKTTTSFEALLRWPHPRRGMVHPSEFIPLAEETGLIVPIGEWVLSTACAQARAWQDQGIASPRISVNLSSRQFLQPDLADMVARVLRDTGLDARCLKLEITESLLMQNVDGAVATLETLKTMGVRLAIDDFGTGYSSLAYLKRFPIDQLKIDQSFVRDITTDPDDAAIASAVIAMARSMKLEVVAEGVETEAQLDFLSSEGCHKVQGYYFSPPIPAEDAMKFFQTGSKIASKRRSSARAA